VDSAKKSDFGIRKVVRLLKNFELLTLWGRARLRKKIPLLLVKTNLGHTQKKAVPPRGGGRTWAGDKGKKQDNHKNYVPKKGPRRVNTQGRKAHRDCRKYADLRETFLFTIWREPLPTLCCTPPSLEARVGGKTAVRSRSPLAGAEGVRGSWDGIKIGRKTKQEAMATTGKIVDEKSMYSRKVFKITFEMME